MGEAAHPADPLPSDVGREHRPEPVPPQPHRLVTQIDPALEQKILDVAQTQWEPDVHHHHKADHLRRRIEVPKWVGGLVHPARLAVPGPTGQFALTVPLPVLLIDAGWAAPDAYRGAVVVQVGGIVGSILAAVFIDRGYLIGALLTLYALAGLALGALAFVPATLLGWNLLIFLIGFGISGTQLILLGATAALYPERMRATSAGWATAIARGGAIAAPLAGGAAMSAGIAPSIILSALAVPMLCQFLTVLWARHAFIR